MDIYMVGGAVRDALLGLPVKDRDWVVVGATPEAMSARGFQPVGKDFPVFLHSETKEEYALARTERKTARGYKGFAVHAAPEVTLEEDLARRDLTINAIAVHASQCRPDGSFDTVHLTDPYHGQRDIERKIFRHVTPAFREDPVRILRVARLAARFTDFTVAGETMELMNQMVEDGEVDHLVAERVWQELSRGLMEAQPSRMFAVLRACGALKRLLPEVDRLWGVPQRPDYHPEIDTGVHVMMVLDMAARLNAPLTVRFACLGHDLGKGTSKLGSDSNFVSAWNAEPPTHEFVLTKLESDPNFGRHIGHEERSARLLKPLCERLRVPVGCRELADVVAREHGNIHRSGDLGAAALVRLLERCDAIRKPQRFAEVLQTCECDARGRLGKDEEPYPQAQRLQGVLDAVLAIDTQPIAEHAQAQGHTGKKVGEIIHAARARAVAQHLGVPHG